MKRIFYALIGLFFLGITGTASAQQATEVQIEPSNPAFQETYRNFDFRGKFSARVLQDTENNYFLVDFSKLTVKYEKVYFMNLSFNEGRIVNLDGDLSHDKIWFGANRKYPEQDILNLFTELKDKTEHSSQALDSEQKSAWLKANDKYK
jgi:hypothetical protein